MNEERLENLIRVLEEVRDHNKPFEMALWFGDDEPMDCNTAACALGWACRDPWMQEQGLGVRKGTETSPTGDIRLVVAEPRYGYSQSGIDAASRFFGLSFDHAEDIFMLHNYERHPSIDDVISRVREIMTTLREHGDIDPKWMVDIKEEDFE
jgi:hypothetical protein